MFSSFDHIFPDFSNSLTYLKTSENAAQTARTSEEVKARTEAAAAAEKASVTDTDSIKIISALEDEDVALAEPEVQIEAAGRAIGYSNKLIEYMQETFNEAPDSDVGSFARGYSSIYNAARTGALSQNEAMSFGGFIGSIGYAAVSSAVYQGRLAYEADLKEAAQARESARRQHANGAKGKVINESGNASESLTGALETLGKKTGFDFRIVENLSDRNGAKTNGFYDAKSGEIVLSAQAENIIGTAVHECTHFIETYAPEEYSALKKAVIDFAKSRGTDFLMTAVSEYKRLYGIKNVQELLDEITADISSELINNDDFVAALFTNKEFISEVAAKNKSLAQRIADFFSGLVYSLKAYIREHNGSTNIGSALASAEDAAERFSEISELWLNALETAGKNYKSQTNENTASEEGSGVRYMLVGESTGGIEIYETSNETKKLSYDERCNQFLQIMNGVYKGRTAKFEVNGKPYYAQFTNKDINKNVYGDKKSDHHGWKAKVSLGAEGDVFDLVERSSYVRSSLETGKNTSAHKGVVSWDYFVKTVQIDGRIYDLIANVRKTLNDEYVYSLQLNENKKMAAPLPIDKRYSLSSNRVLSATFDTTVPQNDTDVNTSISENGGNDTKKFSLSSDIHSEAFKKWFGDWENDPETASKVVDEDGTPLVVYHGSSEDFTVFDREKARANMDIQGNFFSPWEIDAKGYGGNVRAFYLNIKNPAPEGVAYKALNRFKGQNGAGIKAREYLEQLGYDGVNGDGEEYIAFYPSQIKSATDNVGTYDGNNPDIRYSLSSDFSTQIDNVLNNKQDNINHVYMGKTPQRLVNILGLPQLPVLITSSHVYSMAVSEEQAKADGRYKKGTHYHDLGADLIKKLPEALNKPVAIIKSNTDVNSADFVVVTNKFNKYNERIVVAIKPNGRGLFFGAEISANITLSGYGKGNINNYLATAQKENRIIYTYKNSQRHNTPGLQLPDTIMSADYGNSLTHFKQIVNSIIYNNSENSYTISQEDEFSGLLKFQLSDTSEVDYKAIMDENAELKKKVATLQEEMTLTEGHRVERKACEKLAKKMIDDYGSTYDKKTLADNLEHVFNYIASENADAGEAINALTSVAKSVIEKSQRLDTSFQDSYGKITFPKIRLSENMARSLSAAYGSYAELKDASKGLVQISKAKDQMEATSIDSLYQELNGEYQNLFPEDIISEEDQFARILEVAELQKPRYVNELKADEDTYAYIIASELFDEYFDTPQMRTFADKKASELNALRNESRQKLAQTKVQIREQYEKRLADLRAQKNDKISEVREQRDEKILALKAQFTEQKENAREKRNITGKRHQIAKLMKRLESRLLHPTNTKYVPAYLYQGVIDVCRAVNLDTGRTDSAGNPTKASEKLRKLKSVYDKLARDEDYAYRSAYDKVISERIEELAQLTEGKTVYKLSLTDLNRLYEILRAVEYQVASAVKLLGEEKAKDIYETGVRIIDEINATNGYNKDNLLHAYAFATLNPERVARKMTGYTQAVRLVLLL